MPVEISIGIIAWNEEDAIQTLLRSLSLQTIFREVVSRGAVCEVVVVANGCTDQTAQVAKATMAECFGEMELRWTEEGETEDRHTEDGETEGGGSELVRKPTAVCRVVELFERGKLNAWNKFVHDISAPEAQYLFLFDSDILLEQETALWSMVQRLRENLEASVATDVPHKLLPKSPKPLLRNALSRSAAAVTAAAPGQLCAQLYCIRAEVARNIYLPRDLPCCDDGFIKSLVCTDSLTKPLNVSRIQVVAGASHTFEAYTSFGAVLRNQKRQVIGQTVVHILVDKYLPTLSFGERLQMADTLRRKDFADSAWLKRLIADHLREVRFPWRLYPRLLSHRFKHVKSMAMGQRLRCLPGLVFGSMLTLLASFLAYRSLRGGSTDYWPKARRGTNAAAETDLKNHKLNTKLIR